MSEALLTAPKRRARIKRPRPADVPEGFEKRLPAGVERTVRVNRTMLNSVGDPIWVITDGARTRSYAKVRIEGEIELVHELSNVGCTPSGSAFIKNFRRNFGGPRGVKSIRRVWLLVRNPLTEVPT